MMKYSLCTALLLAAVALPVSAQTAAGDAKIGKKLTEKACMACHTSMYGGDGSKIYTRSDRKVRNMRQLMSQVRSCNTNVGAGWLPEEEAHVAAYLNETYYRF